MSPGFRASAPVGQEVTTVEILSATVIDPAPESIRTMTWSWMPCPTETDPAAAKSTVVWSLWICPPKEMLPPAMAVTKLASSMLEGPPEPSPMLTFISAVR